MLKNCTTYTLEWNEQEEDHIKLPEKCLSLTIANQGNSKVAVDETVILEPKQAYPLEHHAGYYHTGQVKLRVVDVNTPYTSYSKVIFRITVECP